MERRNNFTAGKPGTLSITPTVENSPEKSSRRSFASPALGFRVYSLGIFKNPRLPVSRRGGGVGVSPPVWHVRRTRGTRINDDDVQKYVRPTAGARAREESSSFPAEPRFYRVRSRGNRDGRRQSPKTYYIIVVLYTYIVSTYTSILLLLPRDANGIAGLLSAGRAPDNIGFLRRNPDVKNDRWTTMPAGISARPSV